MRNPRKTKVSARYMAAVRDQWKRRVTRPHERATRLKKRSTWSMWKSEMRHGGGQLLVSWSAWSPFVAWWEHGVWSLPVPSKQEVSRRREPHSL